MSDLKDHATVGAPMSNAEEVVRVTYDFADDGGATGPMNILAAKDGLLITGFHMFVEEAVTSDGSATLSVGPTGAPAKFVNGVGKATLTQNYVVREDAANDLPHYLADGQSIIQTIGLAPLSGGKIHYTFKVMKPKQ